MSNTRVMPEKTAFRYALKQYTGQIFTQKPWSFIALLFPGIGSTLTLYLPPLIISRMIVDFDGKVPANIEQTLPYLLWIAGIWTLGEILWRIAFLCLDATDANGMKNLYVQAMDRLLEKDVTFFSNNFAGSLTKKALGYGKSFESFMDTLSFNIFGNLIPLVFASYILWGFSPWLVATLLGAMSFALVIIMPLIQRRQKLVRERERASNKMAAHIADVIGNVTTVRSFANEQAEKQQHEHLVTTFTKAARRSWDYHVTRIDGVMAPLNIVINIAGLVLAMKLTDDVVTLATVFVSFSYFVNASRVLFEFNRTYRNIENSLSEAAQFCELLIEPPKVTDAPAAGVLKVDRGEVVFDAVTFTHDDMSGALFDGFSLRLKSGEKVGIIGRSGAGKSTITNILLRFMDLDEGSIRIDGQDIRDVTQQSLRQHIAYVPQESALFHRTIAENIRYGKPGASIEAVRRAAKLASADEFITELPHGYETLVGERGIKLSGGQRQRIAIARAILKDAPILVLDEATSALDSESEKLIQSALDKLMIGRTTIVVAHRLSTIQKMDRIVVLEKGSIVEQGSHTALLAKNGTYAKLWAHQSGGFLED